MSNNSQCLTMTTQNSLPSAKTPKCYIFNGEIENIQLLIPVLKSICIKRIAVMAITERGLKISCEEESRTVQATAFIERNLFSKYEMRNPSTPETLCFRMSDLLNALAILFPIRSHSQENIGNKIRIQNCSLLKIKYENIDRIKLQVINGNHSAMAYIQTFNPQPLIVFSMSFVNKIILDGSVLIDFWKCADSASTKLRIKILDGEPWFEMATESARGRFLQRVSAHSVHVEHYECTVPLEEQYEMTSIHFTVRPLLLASKVSIRMDSRGLLNMQFIIHLSDNSNIIDPKDTISKTRNDQTIASMVTPALDRHKCFVEFYILPCVD